jgi:hypothetical protein
LIVIPAQARIHLLKQIKMDPGSPLRGVRDDDAGCYALSRVPSPAIGMNALLQKLLQGVDPGTPGAFWRLLHNMLVLIPWWPLVWFTVACAIVGAAIGWWRGRIALGVALGLVVGPIAWVALWALPPGRYGPARRRLDRSQPLERKIA